MTIYEIAREVRDTSLIIRKSVIANCTDFISTAIKLSNSYDCCQLIQFRKSGDDITTEKIKIKNWNPTLDDLMANDWIVIGDDQGINLRANMEIRDLERALKEHTDDASLLCRI